VVEICSFDESEDILREDIAQAEMRHQNRLARLAKQGEIISARKANEARRRAIYEMRKSGSTLKSISEKFGISSTRVAHIVNTTDRMMPADQRLKASKRIELNATDRRFISKILSEQGLGQFSSDDITPGLAAKIAWWKVILRKTKYRQSQVGRITSWIHNAGYSLRPYEYSKEDLANL
jgi:hypothetical protein